MPTEKGVALTFPNCGGCHVAFVQNGETVPGAPFFGLSPFRTTGIVAQAHYANRVVHAGSPFIMGPGLFGERLYQAWECLGTRTISISA